MNLNANGNNVPLNLPARAEADDKAQYLHYDSKLLLTIVCFAKLI